MEQSEFETPVDTVSMYERKAG